MESVFVTLHRIFFDCYCIFYRKRQWGTHGEPLVWGGGERNKVIHNEIANKISKIGPKTLPLKKSTKYQIVSTFNSYVYSSIKI